MLIVAIAAGAAWGQEGVPLAPRLEVGRRDRYAFEAEFTERVGGAPPRVVTQRGVLRISVARVVSGEGATVRLAFEELHAAARDGEDPAGSFDWAEASPPVAPPDPEGAPPPGVAGGEPAAEAQPGAPAPGEAFRAAYTALAGSVLELEVARDGAASLTTGPREAWRTASGPDGGDPRLLGLFAPGALERRVEAILRVDAGWPARPRRVGDTWTLVEEPRLADRATARATTTLRLDAWSEGVAAISGTIGVELTFPPREFGPADFKPDIRAQSGEVSVRWDAQAGRLLERRESRSLELAASLDAGLLESSAAVTSTVRFTFLGPAPEAPPEAERP